MGVGVLQKLFTAGANRGLRREQTVLAHALGQFACQSSEIRVRHLHLGTDLEHEGIAVDSR
ncbi:hypothetical protein WU85_04535 [Corynebacterium striatum]|nr:hypothetical protein WU85_04535 [Corynebacterium striatum]